MRYVAIVLGLLVCNAACAQWTVVFVPSGGFSGVSGGRMSGGWNGGAGAAVYAAGAWTSLHPVGWIGSSASDISGDQQVGHVDDGVLGHACLWTLTPESFIDLHPTHFPNAAESILIGTSGDQQVGWDRFDGAPFYHASLWSGTAASWIDLHPAGALHSLANDVDGGQQVGTSNFPNSRVAGLWTGTAASWVELNPAWGVESFGMGVGDGQQVGRAWDGTTERAVLWRGTAASCVDLHPVGVGATSSLAASVDGGVQVGEVGFAGGARASLWYGTSGSYVDLHSFIPGQGQWSSAGDISQDGSYTRVVGHSEAGATIWLSRMIAPTSYSMFRGTVFSGNFASLIYSDGNKLVMRPGVVLQSSEPPVQIRINSTAPSANPNGISFSVESSASFAFAQQKISLWNYDTGAYELLDTRVVTTSDDTLTVTVRTNAHRFIDNGTLAMRALVSFKAVGPSILYPWSARIDKVWWTFPG